ncbi:unnamed protein product [Amaranthus hypochondriacus]
MFPDQLRVDFVCNGVWALKFFEKNNYYSLFLAEFQDCLFENVHGLKPTENNKLKVYGKDFLGWLNPDDADDTMWDAVDDEQFGSRLLVLHLLRLCCNETSSKKSKNFIFLFFF